MDPGIDRSNLKKVPNLIYEDPSIVTPIHRSERHPWSPTDEVPPVAADIKGPKPPTSSADAPSSDAKKSDA
ncbi:hypothetical protein INT43_008697 [Umbelopsis isabellina]|uniref:Uncharacterized protein n=1 Tax=Mortierella isabellina TaxID=91625 RepID=A0A8H7UFI1_MORIS|nr:hypothetical protein INT43_008697 [Umbelopsis isabellina]